MTETQRTRFADALLRVANDETTLVMMAEITAPDALETIAELRASVDNGDNEVIATNAHKLMGMLSAFVTDEPVSDLRRVISFAKNDEITECRSEFAKLEPRLKMLTQEVAAISTSG